MKKKGSSRSVKPGFVYIFANPSFPDWVKIGKTGNWEKRLKNGNTYTPDDFYPVAVLKTSDMNLVEKRIQSLVGNHVQCKKEFFCVDKHIALKDLRFIAEERGEKMGFVEFENGFPAIGYDAKGKAIKLALPAALRSTLFHAAKKGTSIFMRVKSMRTFVVLKGSILDQVTQSLLDSEVPSTVSIRKERMALENDAKKVSNGKLLRDVEFHSASRALAVMLGCSAMQGPQYWVDNERRPLADYMR